MLEPLMTNLPKPVKLWIDDVRDPPDSTWKVARTSAGAIDVLQNMEFLPDVISFDHDLGGDDTTLNVVDYLYECMYKGKLLPPDFIYQIHSQNPVGAVNIKSKMDQLLDHQKQNRAIYALEIELSDEAFNEVLRLTKQPSRKIREFQTMVRFYRGS